MKSATVCISREEEKAVPAGWSVAMTAMFEAGTQ
jgi:uncharacterized protein YbdZ (MbtH family)